MAKRQARARQSSQGDQAIVPDAEKITEGSSPTSEGKTEESATATMSGSPAPEGKPVEPVQSAPAGQQPPTLEVKVSGDFFYERYLWQTGSAQDLPYLWPDDLRSSVQRSTFCHLSGAPLHRVIFEECLSFRLGKNGKKIALNVKPTVRCFPEINTVSLGDKQELPGTKAFPATHPSAPPNAYAYLHQLEPRPNPDKGLETAPDKVWRITNTLGMVNASQAGKDSQHWFWTETEGEKGRLRYATEIAEAKKLLTDLSSASSKGEKTPIPNRVIVLNDRNLGFRDIFKGVKPGIGKSVDPDTLILWHVRTKVFEGNPLAELLSSDAYRKQTIPLISYQCLRDEGVSLRFDCSYETSLFTLLESLIQDDSNLRHLRLFPHVLIHFDYGVVHLTSDVDSEVPTGLDIHALANGPYSFRFDKYGAVTGRTPILVGCILREIQDYLCAASGKGGGISIENFLKECANPANPTINHSTRLDRAIDTALLAESERFRQGFGNAENSPTCFADSQEEAYSKDSKSPKELVGMAHLYSKCFESVEKRLGSRSSIVNDDSGKKTWHHSLYWKDESGGVDGFSLTRIGVPKEFLRPRTGEGNAQWKKAFFARSRDQILKVDWGLPLSKIHKPDDQKVGGDQGGSDSQDPLRIALRLLVRCGLENLVARKREELRLGAGKSFEFEPSVFCPFVRFNKYLTIDWLEIDQTLAIRNLVHKYIDHKNWNQPLSIAIFGPPGAGKSFIVKQLLKGAEGGGDGEKDPYEFLTCNLSQLRSPKDLVRYFRQIQGIVVRGKTPVMFFDEFDAKLDGEQPGWLKTFLMPMEDGKFVDDADEFEFGRSIFVFAGGVSHRFEDFWEKFGTNTELKVPDFVSRLRGYFDVANVSWSSDEAKDPGSAEIRAKKIRRAVIFRNILLDKLPNIVRSGGDEIQIQDEIIDAILEVPSFIHGVRSITAIVDMSRIAPNATLFSASALPMPEQLRLHVDDAQAFMKIVQGSKSGKSSKNR